MSGPKTRVETYLAALSGENVTLPKPISRIDRYLYNLCQSGGGGVSDYTKLTNKPTQTVGGDTLTWDGNTEGLERVTLDFADLGFVINAYRVSETVVPAEYVVDNNGLMLTDSLGQFQSGEDVLTFSEFGEDGFFSIAVQVWNIPYDNYNLDGVVFPKKGVYFTGNDDGYICSLTIPGYTGFTKEVLKSEVVPWVETVGTDTITWDGNPAGLDCVDFSGDGSMLFCKVSDAIISKEDVANGCELLLDYGGALIPYTLTGEEAQAGFTEEMNGGGTIAEGSVFFIVSELPVDETGEIVLTPGIYFQQLNNGEDTVYTKSLKIYGYSGFRKEQIKEENLPGAIVLYVKDDELVYLYDAAGNKITRSQLLEYTLSNNKVLVKYGIGASLAYISGTVSFTNAYGFIYAVEDVTNGSAFQFYTAEYAPAT